MFDIKFDEIETLTFDIFGTVIDLAGSLVPPTDKFLRDHDSNVSSADFWNDWRSRQRIEQYQDNLLLLGHSGYLETCKRAFIYCLKLHNIAFTRTEIEEFMDVYQDLKPYPDAIQGLTALSNNFQLVALSNGEEHFLEHLINNNIKIGFNSIISVEEVGQFKPHPAIYRYACQKLSKKPWQIMMVAAHAFDILGAKACGYYGAYINRYGLPTEESAYQPDIILNNFVELADTLTS
jgi:2-haloacid dehalogenase